VIELTDKTWASYGHRTDFAYGPLNKNPDDIEMQKIEKRKRGTTDTRGLAWQLLGL
jgi:hypothetical protein